MQLYEIAQFMEQAIISGCREINPQNKIVEPKNLEKRLPNSLCNLITTKCHRVKLESAFVAVIILSISCPLKEPIKLNKVNCGRIK